MASLDTVNNAKKQKLIDSEAENLTTLSRFNSLQGFKLKQLLSDNTGSKSIFVEASFEKSNNNAVILLEKLHFCKDSVDKLLNNNEITFRSKTEDNGSQIFECHPTVVNGDMKATFIYPATPGHLEKYMFQPIFVVDETIEVYQNVVLPHIAQQKFSIQWVHNILEHQSEVERIIFEDPDPIVGFVLLPDLKWDESQLDNIYVIAICHNKSIKSLRDLSTEHIPLLKNIRAKALEAIEKTFNIPSSKLRAYIHYQPSYYHLHVHFNCVQNSMPGTQFEKAHLLDTVITNLSMCSEYYQKVTLSYTIKQNEALFSKLKEAKALKM